MNNCKICNTPLVWSGSLRIEGSLQCPNNHDGNKDKEDGFVEGYGFVQHDSYYSGDDLDEDD